MLMDFELRWCTTHRVEACHKKYCDSRREAPTERGSPWRGKRSRVLHYTLPWL